MMTEQEKTHEENAAADDGDSHHTHEWVVFSTALIEGWLMVQCVECGLHGTVEDPTAEEWTQAFHAPSNPYGWNDKTRVTEKTVGDFNVVRTLPRDHCDCFSDAPDTALPQYDRFPVEITRHTFQLTEAERDEIMSLAAFVAEKPEMCNCLFPQFVANFEEASGQRHSDVTHEIIKRIANRSQQGQHMAAPIVSKVLTAFAEFNEEKQTQINSQGGH